ncbi:uncharacterized protein CELE_Y119C1B.11 [Caenorhabditis elegans]|uniref:Uncharacterized protein n=1 Tax=Caenorhabditis elegans TaxID=6239 RepID=Q4W5T2_CAEEL|nr:Uncharacterized protein CELE_Y119C1B.11 [Caenorhabditis elegans]CCD68306.2 Uncharacterized protein CELE_Y119C1B.11 [Caenorhabditis elegans]
MVNGLVGPLAGSVGRTLVGSVEQLGAAVRSRDRWGAAVAKMRMCWLDGAGGGRGLVPFAAEDGALEVDQGKFKKSKFT